MKTTGLHSPFIDGELLGAPPPAASPFEQVMAEPRAQPMPATAQARTIRVVDAAGAPLGGLAWSLHQGSASWKGVLGPDGETGPLTGTLNAADPAQPFRLHVDGYVCSIVSGAALVADDPAVQYGGALFDWSLADHADPTLRSGFWKDYAQRRRHDGSPAVHQFLQHEHVMRRPVRWLRGATQAVFQAQPLAIRLGPLVRYTDSGRATLWLELATPGLVRVSYGAARDRHRKPADAAGPAALHTRHACSVRAGGRHYALLTLDGLPDDAVLQYTLELAPQPPTGPLPDAETEFSAVFPRQLPPNALKAQQAALRAIAYSPSHWLFLRTLPRGGENLRFAHGSCRDYPADHDDHGKNAGVDMLDRFGAAFLDQRPLEDWPRWFMHTGDQIYADDVGQQMGGLFVRQRFAAVAPGPASGDDLVRGAWGGRFAARHVARAALQAPPPKANLDAVKRQRLSMPNPFRIEGYIERADTAQQRQAVHPAHVAPAAQKLRVMNHLLWQVPVEAADLPLVDKHRGLLMPQVFRVKDPDVRDLRLAHPSAGDVGGIHAADYAEYAALYEQAWTVRDARRALAHLPSYMIFDDHEVTDDWNAGPGWLARVHDAGDKLRMWPTTMTDALAAYWLYQGWGNLSPEVAKGDERVQLLQRARKGGYDALPELRRLIHDRAVLPTRKGADRSRLLNWHYTVPAGATPFLVVDLRTDRDVHGNDGLSTARLQWLEAALRAARTPSAVVVLPVPMLLPAPMLFAMRNPGIPATLTSAPSTAAFKLGSDIEHPATNYVWEQIKLLLQRLQSAGSPLKTVVLVSGDIHFSCNLDAQLPGAKTGPRLLQLVSSGLRNVITQRKRDNLDSAYTGALNAISGSEGVDEHRGMVITVGGLEGPDGKLSNFLFPTSLALVDIRTVVGSPRGKNYGRMALVRQTHFIADGGSGSGMQAYEFRHLTQDGRQALMTLHDPGPANPARPSRYPRSKDAVGLVHEVDTEAVPDSEAEDFELRHDDAPGEAEPALEVFTAREQPLAAEDEAEAGSGEYAFDDEQAFDDEHDSADEALAPVSAEAEVIGDDSRQVVADTLAVPYRWICALDIYYDTSPLGRDARHVPDWTRATGTLIGPRHVLTAAHVLGPVPVTFEGVEYQLPVTRIVVAPARDGRNDKAPLGQSRRVWWGRPAPREIRRQGPNHTVIRARLQDDYALLVVKDNLAATSHPRFGRLGYWGEDPQVSELRPVVDAELSDPVTVAGYPGDTHDRTILAREESSDAAEKLRQSIELTRRNKGSTWAARMWQASGTLRRDPVNQRLLHDADTYQGHSGSPLFAQRDGVWCLLAVHGGAAVKDAQTQRWSANRAAPVTPQMLSQLNGWMNQQGGRGTSSLVNGRLVPAPAAAPTREMEGDDTELEGLADEPGLTGEAADFEDETPDFEDEAASPAGAAALVTRGLGLAEAWLRRQPRSGVPELLRFAVSLLRTHFFPKGHGVINGAGHVAHQAPAARIAMKLRARDGSPLPFEHRVRLWLDARAAQPATVAGRHADALFSSITLHAPAFAGLAPAVAVQHAVHEVLHMLFTLVDRLRQRHGDAMADAFLQKDPWSLLDLRRFDAFRGRLEQALQPLLHLLGAPEPAAAAAGRLVEEAFCYTGGMHLRFTLERGGRSGIVASSVTETLVRHYVLDHSARLSALLGSDELARAVAPLRPVLDELQARMNADWQGDAATPAPQPEALFEPF